MQDITARLSSVNWGQVTEDMNNTGYAMVPSLINLDECKELIAGYATGNYRKTVVMERYRFGLGEYKYFDYPLPGIIQELRQNVYPKLAPIANNWLRVLNTPVTFPNLFEELQELCHASQQVKPTALILKYGKGGFNT